MGQRLVVNIISNDEILASGYFHWSAYTETAAEITKEIVDSIEDCKINANTLLRIYKNNPQSIDENYLANKMLAYLLLEHTGAGIDKRDEKELADICDYNYRKGNHRSQGLIAINPRTINNLNYWAEEIVNIYISKENVSFNVFAVLTTEELIEEDEIKEDKIKEININDIRWFNFSEIDKWYATIKKMCNDDVIDGYYPYYQDEENPDIFYQVIA